MEKWFITRKYKEKFPNSSLNLLEKTKLQILFNRDITNIEEIKTYISNPDSLLNDVNKMKDYDILKSFIADVMKHNKKVYIVGDYDVDGIMSTAIFIKTFKLMGIDVHFKIPHRIEDGYGINSNLVEDIFNEGGDLIITCDNGVQAFDAVKKANKLGIDIIITDHHEIKKDGENDVLPNANAIIDPLRRDCKYPYKSLCGAGIVFKICTDLLDSYSLLNEDIYGEILTFAAIGTICDVVSLTKENRYIATKGILELRKTKNLGLKSLIDVSSINKSSIDTYSIGFIIGPRFNASGRLDTASLGVELLITNDLNRASFLSKELNTLNEERKLMTEEGLTKVLNNLKSKEIDNIIVEYVDNVHESVAGIVAGRIKDKYYRPTIIFTDGKEGLKGSARSIDGFNIFEAISSCESYLLKFGGHKMAAGLSLLKNNLNNFKNNINLYSEKIGIDLQKSVKVDSMFPIELVDMRLLEMINSFKPFGKDNPEPLFADRSLIVKDFKVFGKNRNVIKISFITKTNVIRETVLFQPEEMFLENLNKNVKFIKSNNDINVLISKKELVFDIIYYPKLNEYRGNKSVDVVITNYRIAR